MQLAPDPSAGKDVSPGPRLSIVIPAFNEVDRLSPTLDRVLSFLADAPEWRPAEIVVVDDGSSDRTADIARSHGGATGVEVSVFVHPRNRGKGAAVRTGFGRCRGAWVLLTDADMSAPIEDLSRLASAAEPDAVAAGSRAVDRRLVTQRQPLHRDLMGRTFNLAIRALGLTRLRDTQCGFKLFPGALARDLAAAQRLDGFAFDVELLVLSRTWGVPVREVGVHWEHVEASRVMAVRHSSQMLRDALRLAWWRATGRLPPRRGGPS
jgi:dolichyl-phosphate beta-glucosyltransferase